MTCGNLQHSFQTTVLMLRPNLQATISFFMPFDSQTFLVAVHGRRLKLSPLRSNLLNTCCWLVETAQQALGGRGGLAEQLEGYCTTSRRDLADVRIGSAFL